MRRFRRASRIRHRLDAGDISQSIDLWAACTEPESQQTGQAEHGGCAGGANRIPITTTQCLPQIDGAVASTKGSEFARRFHVDTGSWATLMLNRPFALRRGMSPPVRLQITIPSPKYKGLQRRIVGVAHNCDLDHEPDE